MGLEGGASLERMFAGTDIESSAALMSFEVN